VFDKRIAVAVNSENPTVIARCRACGEACERYVNCARKPCNAQIFLCGACEASGGRFCDAECRAAVAAEG
jgi:UPF0176 protein